MTLRDWELHNLQSNDNRFAGLYARQDKTDAKLENFVAKYAAEQHHQDYKHKELKTETAEVKEVTKEVAEESGNSAKILWAAGIAISAMAGIAYAVFSKMEVPL